jgi:hypothetical protein
MPLRFAAAAILRLVAAGILREVGELLVESMRYICSAFIVSVKFGRFFPLGSFHNGDHIYTPKVRMTQSSRDDVDCTTRFPVT